MSYADDSIVDEVRRVRREHAERYGYDLRRIFQDLKESERQRGRPAFSGQPKRVRRGRAGTDSFPSPSS